MTKLVHLSDLHFGTEDQTRTEKLIATVNNLNSDAIIITGDLTQRAKSWQFKAAQSFINSLGCRKIICVPGNHDIPLHNIFYRFLFPFFKYKRYITTDLNPTYCDDKVAILGINSATPFTVMDGHVSQDQLRLIKEFFSKVNQEAARIICMHHNMIQPELHKVLVNLEEVLLTLAESKVQLILSGHLHDAFIEKIERPYINYNMYVVTAGTALSSRLRTKPQSFNLMTVGKKEFVIQVYALGNSGYVGGEEKVFSL